jgi:hypothetical protein
MIEDIKDIEDVKNELSLINGNLMAAVNTASLAHGKVPNMVDALAEMRTYYANLDVRLQAIEARLSLSEVKIRIIEDDGK